MYKINFKNPIKIHFIGIGGISMSGLAEILLNAGFVIVGSDVKQSAVTDKLESLGIQIYFGQNADNLEPDIDLVVYTAAIKEDNPEFAAVIGKNIPRIDRATLLGQMMSHYKNAISVAGTHGKTTTTSLITQVLLSADKDPTVTVGGILDAIGGNIRVGQSDTFITEACEYCNSFLKFTQRYSVILNIEEDHMDFFHDIDEIRNSFRLFAEKLPADGALIINGDIENLDDITKNLECKIITYGTDPKSNTYSAVHITFDSSGNGHYDLTLQNQIIDHIDLNVAGMHNIFNSLAAIALGREMNIPMSLITKGLWSFKGTHRRFELKGHVGGITVMDDYAHHPTEIKTTLEAAKKCPFNQIWVVFQPHTYTRTKAFLTDFAKSLVLADHIILTDIYAAREKDPGDIHAKDLESAIKKVQPDKDVCYFSSFDDIESFLLTHCSHGNLLITMGAGDVDLVGTHLLGSC